MVYMASKDIFATNRHTFATTNIFTPSPPKYPTSVLKGGLPEKNVVFLWTLFPGGIFFQMSQNLFLDEKWLFFFANFYIILIIIRTIVRVGLQPYLPQR